MTTKEKKWLVGLTVVCFVGGFFHDEIEKFLLWLMETILEFVSNAVDPV